MKIPEKKQQDLFADHDFDIKIDLDVPSTGKLNFILVLVKSMFSRLVIKMKKKTNNTIQNKYV